MRKFRDTPNRYFYRDIGTISAFTALGFIKSLRRAYPQLHDELERDRLIFVEALKVENEFADAVRRNIESIRKNWADIADVIARSGINYRCP